MSAGGKALAESLGQFGGSVQELGKSLFSIEADNIYRVQSLNILNKIKNFNATLDTDPDHGTPGQNDGYMKKWNEYELSLRKDISQIPNPLAKKNLESFLGEASVKQQENVQAKQLEGWHTTQKTYLAQELDTLKADNTLTTDQKLEAVTGAINDYKQKTIIDDAEGYNLSKAYTQDIIKDDYVKGALSAYSSGGFAAYKQYVKDNSPVSRTVNGINYSIDSGTIETANSAVRILAQPDTEAGLAAYNTSKAAIYSLKKQIIDGTDAADDTFVPRLDAIEKDVMNHKTELGSSFDTMLDELSATRSAYRKNVSTKLRGQYESKILAAIDSGDPEAVKNSVPEAEIWNNCTIDDASYLSKLKLSGKKDATVEQQDQGIANLANLYSANEKLKRGESLEEGETPLSRETLKTLLDNKKISSGDYTKYLQQLDADSTNDTGMKSYWKYRDDIDSGKLDLSVMQNDKSLPFNYKLNLADLWSKKSGDTELGKVQQMALNLRRVMNGETLGDDSPVLTYTMLDSKSPDYIKDPQARSVALAALSDAVEFYRQCGKSEDYLRTVDNIVNGKITDGASILKDANITDPANRVELYSFFMSFTRQQKTWGREDRAYSKQETQDANAWQVMQKFQAAYDTQLGKAEKGQETSWDDFKVFVNSLGPEALDTNVARTYLDLANRYEAGQIGGDLEERIRAIGNAWVDGGAVDMAQYNALLSEVKTAKLPDNSSYLALLDNFKDNAVAAGRQAKSDQRVEMNYQQGQKEYTKRKDEQDAVDDLRKRFTEKLNSKEGISDKDMMALQNEMFTKAPDLFESNWHTFEAMRTGKTDPQFWTNYKTALDAFREHENAKTIDGWKSTSDELTADLIDKLFPGDTEQDVKANEYWKTQLSRFDASQAAIQIEQDKEIDQLSRARSNSWTRILGVGQLNDDAGYLSNELIDQATHLSGSQRASFRDDIDAINRAAEAIKAAEAKGKSGEAPSADQVALGKKRAQFLSTIASTYEASRKSFASLPVLTYVDHKGVTHNVEYTLDGYKAYMSEFADDLAAAGLLDQAARDMEKMTSKVSDPVWATVQDAIKKIGKAATPEVLKWVDLEIQNTKPSPEAATKLAEAVSKKGISISMDSTFKIYTGAYDVSEKYIEAAMKGNLDVYMVTQNNRVMASNSDFQGKFDSFAAKSLDAINETLPQGKQLSLNKNCEREDYENGMVMYRIADTSLLSQYGISKGSYAKRAVAYLGLLGRDAVPIVEVQMKDGTRVSKAWYQQNAKAQGSWVDVVFTKDSDGVTRATRIGQPTVNAAKVSVAPTEGSIFDYTVYP